MQSHTHRNKLPELRAPITVVRVLRLGDFLNELRNDAARVRHGDVRWQTETVTSAGVFYELFIAGYIAEHGDQPKLIEFRQPCGRLGLARRAEDIAAQEQIAGMLEEVQRVASDCGMQFRPGRFSLAPSPLMPSAGEVLRSLCPGIATPEGASYAPWTDGWAVGVETRSRHGIRTLLYLSPSETEEGEGSVLVYQGATGTPGEDKVMHRYDPFTQPRPLEWYTVRTDNGDRMWRAVNGTDASRQHQEAFGGLPGEHILAVLLPAKSAPARP